MFVLGFLFFSVSLSFICSLIMLLVIQGMCCLYVAMQLGMDSPIRLEQYL